MGRDFGVPIFKDVQVEALALAGDHRREPTIKCQAAQTREIQLNRIATQTWSTSNAEVRRAEKSVVTRNKPCGCISKVGV